MSALRLRYRPHPGQVKVHALAREHRFVTAVCGRRWGKTRCGLEEVRRRMVSEPGIITRWTSPVYSQAKARFRAMSRMLRDLGPDWVVESNKSELRLVLRNEAEVQFWSVHEPQNLLGEGVDYMVVDEAGFTPSDVWSEILRPMLSDTLGGALIIGTPRGRGQFLHVCYGRGLAGESGWVSHHAPTWSSPRIVADEIEAAKRELPEDVFRQEYGAEFLDAVASVFRGIRECIGGRLESPRPGVRYVLGVDLAKTRDFTVLIVLDVARRQLVHFERHRGMDYVRQVDLIVEVARRYNGALIVIDETGVGKPVVDGIRAALGGSRREFKVHRAGGVARSSIAVQGITLTNESKADLIQKLQLDLEQRRVHYPELPELLAELEVYSYEMTRTGKVAYNAPSGFHDDAVISLALANFVVTAESVRDADPVLRDIHRVREQMHGALLYGGMVTGSGPIPYERYVLDTAELRRRYELGMVAREEYDVLRREELPFEGWDSFYSTFSRFGIHRPHAQEAPR